jgi:hypothetical protein
MSTIVAESAAQTREVRTLVGKCPFPRAGSRGVTVTLTPHFADPVIREIQRRAGGCKPGV